jgi:cation-transporting ATPase I
MGVTARLRGLFDGAFRHPRRIWRAGGRAHIEVRGGADAAAVGRAAEGAVAHVEGVEWAKFDPVTSGVLVALPEGVDIGPLIAAVEEVERAREHGDDPKAWRPTGRGLPNDPASLSRESLALLADGAAFGFAVTGRLARIARLPVEIASVVGVVESQPRLRRSLESLLGRAGAEVALGFGNAVGQGRTRSGCFGR